MKTVQDAFFHFFSMLLNGAYASNLKLGGNLEFSWYSCNILRYCSNRCIVWFFIPANCPAQANRKFPVQLYVKIQILFWAAILNMQMSKSPIISGYAIFFKANSIHSSVVAILELIRGAQCLIEVIRSSGEEMWRVDAYQIPHYSRGIEEAKRTHPRFADWTLRSYFYPTSLTFGDGQIR